jgi:hypothetical protein
VINRRPPHLPKGGLVVITRLTDRTEPNRDRLNQREWISRILLATAAIVIEVFRLSLEIFRE